MGTREVYGVEGGRETDVCRETEGRQWTDDGVDGKTK